MPRWWERPFRVFQTNLREIDATLDVERVARDIRDLHCNTWLINAGGIVSFYPSKLPYQHPSPWLAQRPGGDLLKDAIEEAHRHAMRVIARIDFSKLHRDVFEQHPDWFFISADGRRQIYNGLYSTCLNGPYYQEKSLEILEEILDGYAVDAFFFNMFTYPVRDYSGNYYGICHCDNCRRRFREWSGGLELPAREDYTEPSFPAYQEFRRWTIAELAGRIRAFIHYKRDDVALILGHSPDVIMHEVNNAVDRPLPLWRYWAGEVARTSRTAYPDKPVTINSVLFVDIPYRFSAEQPGLIGLHLAQTLAHGCNPYIYVVGTTDQPDRKNFKLAGTIMAFHERYQDVYAGLRSSAEVALVTSTRTAERYGKSDAHSRVTKPFRGAFRMLIESHVPFDILRHEQLLEKAAAGELDRYRALVLPNIACLSDREAEALDAYVARGGGLVATHETALYDEEGRRRQSFALQSLGAADVLAREPRMRSAYFWVDRREELPGEEFELTNTVLLDGEYLYVALREGAERGLRLIPPSRYGPPEKTYWEIETDHPGIIWRQHGRGLTVYFPWQPDRLFYDLSIPEHRQLMGAAVERALGGRLQVETNAPPQVEVAVGRNAAGQTVVHLVNYSGHQDRSFHDPLEIRDIRVRLRLPEHVTQARAAWLNRSLEVHSQDGVCEFVVPQLGLLEMVALQTVI